MIHDSLFCTEELDIWAVVVVEELEDRGTGVDGDEASTCGIRPCEEFWVEVDHQRLQIWCI